MKNKHLDSSISAINKCKKSSKYLKIFRNEEKYFHYIFTIYFIRNIFHMIQTKQKQGQLK